MSYFVNKDRQLPEQEVFPGITGHLVHTERVSIGDFRIKAGTKLPAHRHPHEQTSTVLEGRFLFRVGEESKECGPGDVAIIPPNVEHSAEALTDCRVLDVFGPPREDYRAATEDLLAKRSAYVPIDCGVYDHLEAAIVRGKEVELTYLDEADREVCTTTRLRDLKTENKAEFVLTAGGRWLRLDSLRTLDGLAIDGNCAI